MPAYRNPIIPGFNPDPTISYVEGVGYFIVTSSFEFTPSLPIYQSKDLTSWNLIGHAITRKEQGLDMSTTPSNAGLWAPTLRYHKGEFYLTCCAFQRLAMGADDIPDMVQPNGFYLKTTDIFDQSKWSNLVYYDQHGFDQDLFFDDDGRVYLTTTRFGGEFSGAPTKIATFTNEIDITTGTSLTEPQLTRSSTLGTAEGCHILKKNGWYYLFSAEGGTEGGHQEWVTRSKSPLGPFELPPDGVNPLIYNASHPDIQNTGHMDLVQGDHDQWWAVFLGIRPSDKNHKASSELNGGTPSQLGRETFLAPVDWNGDWPVVNDKKLIELIGDAKGLTILPESVDWIDNFDTPKLDPEWYHIRNPVRSYESLTERPGYLALRGSGIKLTVDDTPTAVLRKQRAFDLDWSTQVEFEPTEGQEAGTAIFTTSRFHAVIAVRGTKEGGKEIVFRKPAEFTVHGFGQAKVVGGGEKFVETVFSITSTEPITFTIKARRLEYEFFYTLTGSDEAVLAGSMPWSYLPPGFTGSHFLLYAQGHHYKPCLKSAYFKYAQWKVPSEK